MPLRIQNPFAEGADQLFIARRIHQIAEAVGRAGEGVPLDHGGIGVQNLPAHLAGNKTVVLPVDQKDRNRGVFHRVDGACGGEVEMTEDPGQNRSQKPGERGRQMHVPAYLPDDGEGRAVGTVGDDPADLRGKRQSGCHQDRRRTHGDSYQKDPGVRSEALDRVPDPVQAVPALFNPEGDGMSPAGAVGTLFDHQQIVPLPEDNLRAAAEVPGGSAAIAVEADVQGGAVMLMIVSAAEAEPVMGADRNRLIGKLAHGGDHRLDAGTTVSTRPASGRHRRRGSGFRREGFISTLSIPVRWNGRFIRQNWLRRGRRSGLTSA